jgi:hypothetical protein
LGEGKVNDGEFGKTRGNRQPSLGAWELMWTISRVTWKKIKVFFRDKFRYATNNDVVVAHVKVSLNEIITEPPPWV